jgi:outer membrane protein assembly factor BamB
MSWQCLPRVALMLIAALSLGGCGLFGGGGDDTIEPPAELVDFDSEIDVRRLWSSKVGGGTERLRLGLVPATDGANIYAGSHEGRVQALNATTGRSVWNVRLDVPLSAGPAYGASGILVFGTADGQIIALNAQTGEERWRQPVGSEVLAPPAVSSGVIVFRSIDGRLRGLATQTGRELWTVEQALPALTLRGDTAPVIAGQIVLSGFDNGRVGAYELTTGNTLWEFPIATPTGTNELERLVDIGAGLVVVGNDVYTAGVRGRAVGIEINTGFLLWQHEISSYAGIGVDVNNVYVTDEFGAIVALTRRGGALVWRQEALRLRDVTAPARFGNALVVGDFEGYLHWLDPTDGRFLARARAASDRITGAPLVVGQTIYVQGDDGTIAAFAIRNDESA